ncbi:MULTISPECIES: hypothetical protein [Enterobacteriaceae]|uniref:hypothetical protein n=1 Tax=Enterobacteriaceae TaxID=543 RepID=UPI000BF078A4|nr:MULTISPECIES: hypothetical protein [Enterobacteriaceae]EFN4092133.1 hypothetical protein [Escherichia coli]EIF4391465.1 hypothetical protein [Escherichia coli]EIH8432752.1 hypothetical protein [Escherichia coli]EIT7688570.1 hypothetical protein [Escherichia coli]EJN6671564.1 hypothetical protein [Escherichia coli]
MFDFLMINSEYVSIVGAVLAFVGTIVLAFSMGKVLWEFMFSIDAISTSIESIADGGDIYVFQGLHERISKAISSSKKPTWIGIILVFISMLMQGYSLYLSFESNKINSMKYENRINEVHDEITETKNTLNILNSKLLAKIDEKQFQIDELKRIQREQNESLRSIIKKQKKN